MITKDSKLKRYCCIYVSEFHLELILVPYIKNKMDKSKIIIFSEKNLDNTIKILLEKINLSEDDKSKILNLNWEGTKEEEFYNNIYDEYTFIINGNIDYISKINKKIDGLKLKNVNIIECFDINEKGVQALEIKGKYDEILNTKTYQHKKF